MIVRHEIIGMGEFTTVDLQTNEIICEYSGPVISKKAWNRPEKLYSQAGLQKDFMMSLSNGKVIDETESDCKARFANNSCEPNSAYREMEHETEDLTVFLVALKPIIRMTEVTAKYGFKISSDPSKRVECRCGARTCRKFLW